MAEKDEEFRHIFDSSLNSYHKSENLKKSKKAYASICRLITLMRNASLCFKFN